LRKHLLNISALIVFLVIAGLSFAQQNLYLEDLTSKTDLPEGSINCLAQDEFGFVWIGTYRGLYRYDGYQVINFSTINPEFKAFKIKEIFINKQTLWVGTLASGLFKIDLTDYTLVNYHKNAPKDRKISDDNVISISTLNDNVILVGTEWGGLNIIDTSENPSENTSSVHSIVLERPVVSEICLIDNDHILIGNRGILLYNLKNKTSKQILPAVFKNHVYEISNLGNKEFLVFTIDGIFKVSLKNGKEEYSKVTDRRIKTALRLKNISDPVFLIGTNDGFTEYNARKNSWTNIITEPSDVIPQDITSFLNTYDDVILVGSENGLFSISNRKKHFQHYAIATENKSPDIISNIVKTDKNLFAGSWGKGILKLNKKTQSLENVRFSSLPDLTSGFIYSMRETNNTIWFSTKENLGIFKFIDDQEPYQLTYYPLLPDENNNLRNYTITYIYERKDKTILLGSWEGVLFYYDKGNDTFHPLKDQLGNLSLLRDFSIFSIAEDQLGNVWAGGNGCGLIKMKIEGDKIINQQLFTEKDGLVSNYVTTVYPSKNNKIWVGTDAGLTVIDGNKFTKAFNKDIIYNIQAIAEDPIGFLWIGTQKGLLRINSNNMDESVKLFETNDGLKNRSFYLNSICTDTDFTFYFGGFNGIDYFMPYKIDYNFNKPVPRITNFYLFNERIFPCNPDHTMAQEKIVTSSKSIRLRYNQNTFSLEFANLEYNIPQKCQFAYMLEGVDIEWNLRDANNRIAYYTKLSPGSYAFRVKSTNNDGVWCEQPTSINIVISPPFWATTWAYIIYFVLSMCIIFLFMFRRIMKEQEKHKQQLKEIEYQKQQELDELKLKFFTNISHEFRTPLTLILGPLAKILETDENSPLKEKHLMIFRNASRLLQLTNRIMDFRKNENEQLKLKVEETNISEFIYNIFLFFSYEAQKRNIEYTFDSKVDQSVLIDQEFVESISFNLLSNAFKYTPDNKSIKVSVDFDDQWLKITFSDTGKGLSTEHLNHIFDRFYSITKRNSAGIGLSFSKRLIEIHKGDILVESELGVGSTFTLCLPKNDVYSPEEKTTVSSKETIVDWKKIDQSIQTKVSEDIAILKSNYDKEELIALIVDDNFEVRQFIRELLDTNFQVFEASNGKQALETAFEIIPDIIISDIMMPEMDGLELCSILKTDERTDHIPVVLTTVLSSQTDRIEGLSKGADSYIPKPIDPDHLLVRVNKLIEKELKLKEKFNLSDYSPGRNSEDIVKKEEVHPLIEKARNIVLKNLDNSEYNIDDFCSDLGLSRMQLYRKFKAITGLSANSFIRKVRLHKAAELLRSGELTVKEVTYDVGFIDLKYFRKCFNDEFGVNPSEYGQTDHSEK
jgi:signal transduction histidine kinase/AraC-like DNA-binding protein/ligand-binding sensor domain-containing protein